jgi:TonB-linked SusC/RagA family outer membrane protein
MRLTSTKSRKTIRLLVTALFACMVSVTSWAQHRLTGVVTDGEERPLTGVIIQEVGNESNVALSGTEGRFSMTTRGSDASVSASIIGYKTQTVAVAGQTQIVIALTEDVLQMESVVVVGYGSLRRSDLTGSVVSADMEALQDTPAVSFSQLLKGTVPGLNIGTATNANSAPSINIRGQNSLSGASGPLIVLDGIIYRGNMIDINPADIGSIDVLKDASAAAIYGSQATNGVVIITTKTQRGVSKPIIEYSAQLSLQSTINPKMKLLDREGYLQMVADSFMDESRTAESHWLSPNPAWDPRPKFIEPELTVGYADGTDTDWYGLTTIDQPYIQNHNLSVRGRTENSSYFTSFGITDQKNLIRHDNYKRYSFRTNLETNITSWLKVGTQTFFTLSDSSGQTANFDDIGRMQPLIASHNPDGTLIEKPARGNTNFLLLYDNPDVSQRYMLNGTFFGEIKVPWVKGLSYRVNYSTAMTFNKAFRFDPYANNNLGSGYKRNTFNRDWTLDNIVTYNRSFGDHEINATLVYGTEYRENEYTNAEANNFADLTLGYNNLGLGQADLAEAGSSAWKETSLYQMARVVYSYQQGKYSLTGTIRRDGFSGFSPTNKFAIFPSVGAAWGISRENFFQDNVLWVDNLKLRASYGENGNRTVDRYDTMARLTMGNGYVFGDGGTAEKWQWVSQMSNYDLKWETTTAFNIGLDFSLWKGRFYGTYEFYSSRTKDQLWNKYVTSMHGMGANYRLATNIGKVGNSGHELMLGFSAFDKKDFGWDIKFVFSRNRSKLITIDGTDANGDGREDDIPASSLFIGQPLNAVYDYRINGMWQVADREAGKIPNGYFMGTYIVEDLDGDGNVNGDADDREVVGYRDPSFRFSIQNTLRYKNFDLNIFVNSVQGGKKFYQGQPLGSFYEGKQWNFFEFDYWTPENPDAKYRQPGAWGPQGSGFSPWVARSFIRLQELSLGYNLPKGLLDRVGISRVRVYASANNLFTITKWDGWDPEANQGVQSNLRSGAVDNYPTMRNFTFGLNLEF